MGGEASPIVYVKEGGAHGETFGCPRETAGQLGGRPLFDSPMRYHSS